MLRPKFETHAAYMYRQGTGWIVVVWDPKMACLRESGPMYYWDARITVGTANCRHATDGKCDVKSHQHSGCPISGVGG